MSATCCSLPVPVSLVFLLTYMFCLLPANSLYGQAAVLQPLRLSYLGTPAKGQDCDQHGPPSQTPQKKGKTGGGRPAPVFESEHRPVAERTYYFNDHRRKATVKAFVRRPDGTVAEPELFLGYKPHVSFSTPLGDGPVHGPNSVYVVEQGVDDGVLSIRTAKWITMHHNCGWGHEGKFDKTLTIPQPLESIPFEIVVDKLWDTNFHLDVASGDRLNITVLSYGRPVSGATVTLSSEKGWGKKVVTDSGGRATMQLIRDYYPPLWSSFQRTHRGEFLVTARHETARRGEFGNDSYDRVSYVTTLPWQYTPSSRDYASYSHGLALVLLVVSVSGFGVYLYRERRKKPYRGISFDE